MRLLPYAVGIGAALAMFGALALFVLGGLNLAWAARGSTDSSALNAAFGVLFIVAALSLLAVAAIAAWFARSLLRGHA